MVTEVDLNLNRQVKDKWCFPVSFYPDVFSKNQILFLLPFFVQMTARYDMYAEELAEAIKPDYKPQIVHE